MIRRLMLSLAVVLPLAWSVPEAAAQSASTSGPKYTSAASAVKFNKSRFPQDRQSIEQSSSFPNLKGDYEVLEHGNHKRYNCIAHSLGIHDQWVNPETGPAGNPLR